MPTEPTESKRSQDQSDADMYRRFFERERAARKAAEKFLEDKSRELYDSNVTLTALAKELEGEVAQAKADLARRKALERQLAHAQKMESVGQLAAGVAHELNTPIQFVGDNINFLKSSFDEIALLLQRVDGLLELCRDKESFNDQVSSIEKVRDEIELDYLCEEIPLAATQALEGTQTLSRIVKAMKVFSHPGTTSFEKVNLNQLIESSINVSRSEWKYHAKLVKNLAVGMSPIECMPGELGQALLNLIVNAANAMSDNPAERESVLTVGSRQEDGFVVVDVSDTGCGIPPEIHHRVFDPFFTTKAIGEGTGQGLSICYRIVVELHGGSMTFESAIGEGTTFEMRLPIESRIASESLTRSVTPDPAD